MKFKKRHISLLIITLITSIVFLSAYKQRKVESPIAYKETGGSRSYLHELIFPVGATTASGSTGWRTITLDFDNAAGWVYDDTNSIIYTDANNIVRFGTTTALVKFQVDPNAEDLTLTASGGDISFGDENLATTGTFSAEDVASTDDADITDNLTAGDIIIDEAAGVLAFSGATSASILTTNASQNVFTIGGSGETNNEDLAFDFETTADEVGVASSTSVSVVDFGTIDIESDKLITSTGSTGGNLYTYAVEADANITASATITIQVNVPSGARLIGCQLRVNEALAAGETWDAAYATGATQSIATNQAVAQNTKVNQFFDEIADPNSPVTSITSDETDITIQKNSNPGVDTFTAQGQIKAIVYYQAFTAMGDAS